MKVILLKDVKGITTPYEADNVYHAYHLYIIQVEDRKGLYDFLREKILTMYANPCRNKHAAVGMQK